MHHFGSTIQLRLSCIPCFTDPFCNPSSIVAKYQQQQQFFNKKNLFSLISLSYTSSFLTTTAAAAVVVISAATTTISFFLNLSLYVCVCVCTCVSGYECVCIKKFTQKRIKALLQSFEGWNNALMHIYTAELPPSCWHPVCTYPYIFFFLLLQKLWDTSNRAKYLMFYYILHTIRLLDFYAGFPPLLLHSYT